MSKPVRTMGDLRGKLLDMIDGVMSGKIDPAAASAVVKIAAQVNNSLLAEIETNRFAIQQKRAEVALGELTLAPEADPAAALPPGRHVQASPLSSSMGRIIDRRPDAGTVHMGEPPPGRSALDQRRAAVVSK
jgi:hypothetical protein